MKANLHEALNFDRTQPNAVNLTCTGRYPELVQFHDRKAGKTYLCIEDYGDRDGSWLVSDVCVLDYGTGRMTVIPREDIDLHNPPWEHPRRESNPRPFA